MVIDDNDFLIHFDDSVVNLADTDSSDIFVVVDRTDQYLCTGFRVSAWRRDMFQDGIK